MTTLPIIRRPFLLDSFFNEVFTDDFWTPFDKQFNDLARQLNSPKFLPADKGYPKVNVIEFDDKVKWEVTVTGLSKDDLEVKVADQTLTVRSVEKKQAEDGELLHRGISYRQFSRSWTLAEDVVVNDAQMANGMLTVHLERVVPDETKPRTINIK